MVVNFDRSTVGAFFSRNKVIEYQGFFETASFLDRFPHLICLQFGIVLRLFWHICAIQCSPSSYPMTLYCPQSLGKVMFSQVSVYPDINASGVDNMEMHHGIGQMVGYPETSDLGPNPLPLLVTFGGHHWRPVQFCSFGDLHRPTKWHLRSDNRNWSITSFGRNYTYIETLWKEVKWSMKWSYSMQLNQSRNVLFQTHHFYDHIWSIEH